MMSRCCWRVSTAQPLYDLEVLSLVMTKTRVRVQPTTCTHELPRSIDSSSATHFRRKDSNVPIDALICEYESAMYQHLVPLSSRISIGLNLSASHHTANQVALRYPLPFTKKKASCDDDSTIRGSMLAGGVCPLLQKQRRSNTPLHRESR